MRACWDMAHPLFDIGERQVVGDGEFFLWNFTLLCFIRNNLVPFSLKILCRKPLLQSSLSLTSLTKTNKEFNTWTKQKQQGYNENLVPAPVRVVLVKYCTRGTDRTCVINGSGFFLAKKFIHFWMRDVSTIMEGPQPRPHMANISLLNGGYAVAEAICIYILTPPQPGLVLTLAGVKVYQGKI
jgi:hypothetical protein